MVVYLTIYTFSYFLLVTWNFCSTFVTTTKNAIYDILNFYSLISTNIPSLLVTIILRHALCHSVYRCLIVSLGLSLHHLQIAQRRFCHKMTSLWMRYRWNLHPIVGLWEQLHHLLFTWNRCHRRSKSLWMRSLQNLCPISSISPSIYNLQFARKRCHLIKYPIVNSLQP